MKLKLAKLYKQLLKEQIPMAAQGSSAPLPPPSAAPTPETKNVIELKEVNTTISLFPAEKKLVFTPQEHASFTERLKLYVDVLHQNFMIDKVNHLAEGVFEMVFDPREDFQSVVQFLTPQGSDV